ncbi:hypothetical protein [Thioalkalivibrio paradoxus]|uniref:Uncharacterized protein n=1 Tax=Thioalkalivibrio paradoxus ARh 1 TaxID=713585 RepID=W0DLQ0_9GAMM|nr:hypothetical protein [Thioalkalivibrio paradoxus]AHE99376.1 hypothetical protein THITH_15020 [Thioalkalivibrio paradoxus ARh 1]
MSTSEHTPIPRIDPISALWARVYEVRDRFYAAVDDLDVQAATEQRIRADELYQAIRTLRGAA